MSIPLNKMEYLSPKTLDEALSLLDKYGVEAKLIAGGTDLIPLLKRRATSPPKYLIDLGTVEGLNYIKYSSNGGLRIGALTTLNTLEKSEIIKEKYPSLYEACKLLGTISIRNMATVGGNICRASPASDLVPPLLTFDSAVKIASPEGERIVNLENFFVGPNKTILKPNEIVIEVHCPPLEPRSKTFFIKKARVFHDLAKVNMAVLVFMKEKILECVKIALGAVAPTPIRATKTEEYLKGKVLNNDLIEEAMDLIAEDIRPITDVRSTADYRKHLCKILLKRILLGLVVK